MENHLILTDHTAKNSNLLTVMSVGPGNFESDYELLEEIGRGGFSVVYACSHVITKEIFAAKIIDLRPLRLREQFNPTRLRREVDIMRKLNHPNIIKFQAVYETPDRLYVVMEYSPGKELFDVILERVSFSEQDARPIFKQIASALLHLHNLGIIHRDIKPENVLVVNNTNPVIAKLLDFGLSKHANLGSMAKTFVGTPCYLAPEVELTAMGKGGTYGPAADCWGLGAVLYVMLVARFPEFDRDHGIVRLRLPDALWRNKSRDVKDLISSLMTHDPVRRLTARLALQHVWLAEFREEDRNLPFPKPLPAAASTLANGKRVDYLAICDDDDDDFFGADIDEMDVGGEPELPASANGSGKLSLAGDPCEVFPQPHIGDSHSHDKDMYSRLRQQVNPTVDTSDSGNKTLAIATKFSPKMRGNESTTTVAIRPNKALSLNEMKFTSLLQLQRSLAQCFEEAHASYLDMPAVAVKIRSAAVNSRWQLGESIKLLQKVEQTAIAVLNMFPDLLLAVEENEPMLAKEFFEVVRNWMKELHSAILLTQKANQSSIDLIQDVMSSSAAECNAASNHMNSAKQLKTLKEAIQYLQDNTDTSKLSGSDVLDLFMNLFGQSDWKEQGKITDSDSDSNSTLTLVNTTNNQLNAFPPNVFRAPLAVSTPSTVFCDYTEASGELNHGKKNKSNLNQHINSLDSVGSLESGITNNAMNSMVIVSDVDEGGDGDDEGEGGDDEGQGRHRKMVKQSLSRNRQVNSQDHLSHAFTLLHNVDTILDELGLFWGNTDIVLEALTKKGQHAEQFISFGHNPKLLERFKERLSEYQLFWENILSMSSAYLQAVNEPQKILDKFMDTANSTSPPQQTMRSGAGLGKMKSNKSVTKLDSLS